jgi:endosialidase-like protein
MPPKKITELTALTTPASTDVMPVVDMSGVPATKKSTLAQIAAALTLTMSQITGLVAALAGKVATTVSLTAGAGLTGGGDLSADRTFAVGAGTGVTVNADDVAVNYGTTGITACVGNDSRLSDARTPTAHATTHKSGGTDSIKLDELAAPTDVTTLDVSTTLHGLIPKAVAPAAGLQNVYGIANGETAVTNKPLFDTTNPAALGTAAPGTSLIAARRDHVHATPTNALLDGAAHSDTLAGSVTRGDIIFGNSTPKWARKAVGTGVLVADGTDVTGWTQAPTLTTPSMTAPTVSSSLSTPSIITASGALGITPASGSNVNITLSTTGDLAVNSSQFYVDTSTGSIGIGTASPSSNILLDMLGAAGNNTAAFFSMGSSSRDNFIILGSGRSGDKVARFFFPNAATNASFSGFDIVTSAADTTGVAVLQHIAQDGSVQMTKYGAGTATFDANGNITSVSDLRLKENVVPYTDGLAAIRQLRPIRYNWTQESKLDTARTYVGFGAQDVQPWLPDAVDEHRKTGDLSFNPQVIIAALVNAVQTLAARLDALEGTKAEVPTPVTNWAVAVGLDPTKFLSESDVDPKGKSD